MLMKLSALKYCSDVKEHIWTVGDALEINDVVFTERYGRGLESEALTQREFTWSK